MIASIPQLFAEIRRVIGEQVLPQLDAATWIASDVRCCLTLLTYLEDVVAHGEAMLADNNRAMREYIDALLARTDISWVDAGLRTRLATLPAVDGGQEFPDMSPLERENFRLQRNNSRRRIPHCGARQSSGAVLTAILQPTKLVFGRPPSL
jgi:hypothetical protein